MTAVGLLLLMLLGLCHGVVTSCDGRQNNTKCHGALGGSVVFHLLNDTMPFIFMWWKDSEKVIERHRGSYVVNKFKGRSEIISRAIMIKNLDRDDAGQYKLEIFNADGKRTGLWILDLLIQAPVSSVWMTSQCLSQGETKASCHLVKGDRPFKYSWSLDGVPQVSSGSDSSSIILERGESGYAVCNVSNSVSTASAGQMISECVFIDCTLYSGRHISNWVPGGVNIKCYEPTTTTTSSPTEGKEADNHSVKQTLHPPP